MTHKKPNYLKSLHDEESRVYDESLEELGSCINLAQLLAEACGQLCSVYNTLPDDLRANDSRCKAVLLMLMSCQYQLLAAPQALMRGHLADSALYKRRAIEFALFSLNLFEVDGSAEAWFNAAQDEERYRSKFKIMRMLDPKKHPDLNEEERTYLEMLIASYHWLSMRVHGTFWLAVMSLRFGDIDDGFTPTFVDDPMFRDAMRHEFLEGINIGCAVVGLFIELVKRFAPDLNFYEVECRIEEINSHPSWDDDTKIRFELPAALRRIDENNPVI